MLVRIVCLALFLFGAKAISAETNPQKVRADIRAVMEAQQAAWNRGNVDGFMNGYARTRATVFVSGNTVTRGWQTVRDRYKKKYATAEEMGQLEFSDLEITPLGSDAAVVLGRWELKRKSDHPRFTLIFRRTTDGWRIVHDHTSAAK
jgi:ketosteroid isomerase-like protein